MRSWRAVLALVFAPFERPVADRWRMDASPAWVQAGCWVRITGLAKAPQHNGKVGKVSAKAAQDGRVGVELGKGRNMQEIIDEMVMVAEGAKSAPAVMALAAEPSARCLHGRPAAA